MTDVEARFHEIWLGLVQPTEGLVVSIPALVDAQCMTRVSNEVVERFLALASADDEGDRSIDDLPAFFEQVLGHAPAAFDAGDAIPADVKLYVPEGGQTLRPSLALKRQGVTPEPAADASPAARAASGYVALVWDIPSTLDLDRPETTTGPWEYPPSAKFDRLLRECRVPIGILTNRRAVRLVYAPAGESSGSLTFRVDHMAISGGRPILDALVMLLGRHAFFTAAENQSLPALLADSRTRQANVTNELAEQVLDAVQILLRGFELAAERDGSSLLQEAVASGDDQVYGGLLTVLLRLVFVLYAEAWDLVPTESSIWARDYSVLALFAELREDAGQSPDSMSRRYGAWGRLLSLFRAIYLGVDHKSAAGSLHVPPRRGNLFDPERYPFLEGWPPVGGAPISDPAARAAVRVPTIDDETVLGVLERLVILQGQRLSYKNLDVEQLGSVYEGLMGYHVERLESPAVALKVKQKASAARAWVEVAALRKEKTRRGGWLADELGFDKATAKKVAAAIEDTKDAEEATEALLALAAGKSKDKRAAYLAPAGRLVLQPGPERRRTSSHYTPRELSAPIVRRTLEPLLRVMGDAPGSDRILNLKVCDPAMGSGAFLVEACRFLGDEVVKAWAREGRLVPGQDPTLAARRLVAQRCLYGVDKNAYAVELAKLSLWLVTLAKDLPFTFLDHSMRHGDSLVGLDFDQIRAGHWAPKKQVETAEVVLREALGEAIAIRQEIVELAQDPSPATQRLKEQKLGDADDALKHARLLADVVVGAFFAKEKDKDREAERKRRVEAFAAWKASGELEVPEEIAEWQREIRARLPVFHWMLEFPEVFYAERPDPLDEGQVNRAAYMDAFVGNPPFSEKNDLSADNARGYIPWLLATIPETHGNANAVGFFFRTTARLCGTHGSLGLIATNTIREGDTRASGLQPLLRQGWAIFDATTSKSWPGAAAVAISVVHMAVGRVAAVVRRTLDGKPVRFINSSLDPRPERADPAMLASNEPHWYQGAKVYGDGFVLEPDERDQLVAADPAHAALIRPYLGGEELNSRPDLGFDRYVISFGQQPLEEARRFKALLSIVETRARPDRERAREDTADGAHRKKYWWQFAQPRPELFAAIAPLARCLAASRHTKHVCFAFQPVDRIFSEALNIFVLEAWTSFAVMQSRVHEGWARLLSSSMRTDLRYAASDCFETFPFPRPDPRAVIPDLDAIGQRLYDARAKYMLDEQVGLTTTYNRLKDPAETERRIVALRRLHEEMDAAVLHAYGWDDIDVPPFCIATPADQKVLDTFETEVIDRLFLLNAERAEEERRAIVAAPRAPAAKKPGATTRSKRGKKPDDAPAQPSLFGEEES